MLEALISTAKLLVSKGGKDAMQAIYQRLTRRADWRRDFTQFDAKIRKRDREHARAFGHTIRLKMQQQHKDKLGFSDEYVNRFLTIYYELVDNGFAHGCVRESDSIAIRVTMFGVGTSVEVINNNRSKKIPDISRFKNHALRESSERGLALVFQLANQIAAAHSDSGLKIGVFWKSSR